MQRSTLSLLLAALIICLLGCGPPPEHGIPPGAVNGVIDVSPWPFEERPLLRLRGNWNFYWDELYTPDQLTEAVRQTAVAVEVPEDWDSYEHIENPTPNGFATYQLTITGLKSGEMYALYIDSPNTSFRLWIDGKERHSQGIVGRTRETSLAEKHAEIVQFQAQSSEAELVLHVANFYHRSSGLTNDIIFGLPTYINEIKLWGRAQDALLFGVLFIIAFYHLGIFFFRRQNKSPLYFAIMSGLIALRIAVSNEKIILLLFPGLTWDILLRIDYLTLYWFLPVFAMFLHTLYPKDIPLRAPQLLSIPTAGFSLFVFFLPLLDLSYHPIAYQYIFVTGAIYAIWVLGRIIYKQRDGAKLIALATSIIVMAGVIDAISTRGLWNLPDIVPYGFLAAIFIQAILIAQRFSNAVHLAESTQLELKQSEEKYRTIFENSNDLVYLIGENAQIEEASPSSLEILGYTREELTKLRMHDLVIGEQISALFAEATRDKHAISNREMRLKRKDGRIIDAIVSASWRYDESGTRTGMQGILRDITGLKREREMERAKDIAEAANKAKSTFLANMSHEIRTPLNAIMGYTEMIKDDAPSDGVPHYVPDLERVLNSSKHLLALINDVLDISKVESGKMELYITSFSLPKLINTAGADAQTLIQKNQNKLTISIDENLDTMQGDETKVRQILFNLLSNAAKFTRKGQITLTAQQSELHNKASVQFTLTDTGIGMTAQQRSTLFEAFVQADETISSSYGGTGLGMALTKQFCELMGGSITADSEKGAGTTFTITLPLTQNQAPTQD